MNSPVIKKEKNVCFQDWLHVMAAEIPTRGFLGAVARSRSRYFLLKWEGLLTEQRHQMCLLPASHGLAKDCSSHTGFSPGRAFSEEITHFALWFVRISFNWVFGWEIGKNMGQISLGGVTARTDLTPKLWKREKGFSKGKGKEKLSKMLVRNRKSPFQRAGDVLGFWFSTSSPAAIT